MAMKTRAAKVCKRLTNRSGIKLTDLARQRDVAD